MRRIAYAPIVAAVLVASYPAYAQAFCAPRLVVLEKLAAKYGEYPIGLGLTSSGSVLELFIGETGSWTITTTTPQGVTCILSAGEHWQQRPPKPRGKRS